MELYLKQVPLYLSCLSECCSAVFVFAVKLQKCFLSICMGMSRKRQNFSFVGEFTHEVISHLNKVLVSRSMAPFFHSVC